MTSTAPAPHDPSIGELVIALTDQSARLIRDEVALAKAELQADVKHAGIGVGLFGGAGLFALFGTAALVAAAIAGLAQTVEVWLAALVVAGGLFILAGVAALIGKQQVSEVGPPKRAIASVQDDVAAVKQARS